MKDILYSEKSVKQLKKIAKSDKKNAAMIINAIEKYAFNPTEGSDVEILKGSFE
ncbi:MAG: hypothetical protein WCH34_09535 [Bacteroidota bacterium]